MVDLQTEVQDHEYLINSKRYQKMSQNRPPQNMPILRLFTLINMVYLQNLAIGLGVQHSKKA